jgi:hypothetical protein
MNDKPVFAKEVSDILDGLFFDIIDIASKSLSLFYFQLSTSMAERIKKIKGADPFFAPVWNAHDSDDKGNWIEMEYDYVTASCDLI